MITAWTKHLKDPEEKAKFEKRLRSSRWILEHQATLLNEMQGDIENYETSYKQYENPNWEYRQADNNGFKRCLKAILRLNNLDPKENNDRQSAN